MIDFLKQFDGTDKTPRDVQKRGLEWIAENLPSTEVLVVKCPVGGGKSAMSVAIQHVTKAPIITPSNILIDQYGKDYPQINSLKGKSHYSCADGISCEDMANVLKQSPCPDCPYQACRSTAIAGEATFYNPMSLYYASRDKNWVKPRFMVVDESHQLGSMILMMSGKKFDSERFDFDDRVRSVPVLLGWLKDQAKKMYALENFYKSKDPRRAAEIAQERAGINYTRQGLEEDPDNYAVWIEMGKKRGRKVRQLHVKPIRPPKFIADAMLSAERVVLFSGTMFAHDIEELLPGKAYKILDLPSPIPRERRPIVYSPVPFKMNYRTDPAKIAEEIRNVLRKHPGENTIIHVSYAMSKNLLPHLPEATISNTAEDKIEMVEKFKKDGGVFLAAGCAEGIDLKGDMCRVNIIPKLLYPNMNDPVVKKRMAQADGDAWVNLETLKVTIQQAGRSTRSEKDHSTCYVLDPGFLWRVKKYKDALPNSFLEAITVRGK